MINSFLHYPGNSIENVRPQEEFRGDRVLETTRESDLEEFIPQTDVPSTGDLSNTLITRPRGQFATDRPVSTLAGNTGKWKLLNMQTRA